MRSTPEEKIEGFAAIRNDVQAFGQHLCHGKRFPEQPHVARIIFYHKNVDHFELEVH